MKPLSDQVEKKLHELRSIKDEETFRNQIIDAFVSTFSDSEKAEIEVKVMICDKIDRQMYSSRIELIYKKKQIYCDEFFFNFYETDDGLFTFNEML